MSTSRIYFLLQVNDENTCTACRRSVKEIFVQLNKPKMRVLKLWTQHILQIVYHIVVHYFIIFLSNTNLNVLSDESDGVAHWILWRSGLQWERSKFCKEFNELQVDKKPSDTNLLIFYDSASKRFTSMRPWLCPNLGRSKPVISAVWWDSVTRGCCELRRACVWL